MIKESTEKFTKLESNIACYAFRYALERTTGAVDDVATYLERNWNRFNAFDRQQFWREIDNHCRREKGFKSDYAAGCWRRVKALELKDPYYRQIESDDHEMTIGRFNENCENGSFIDYDGYGYPAKFGKMNPKIKIYPSRRLEIPADATHIVWFNR